MSFFHVSQRGVLNQSLAEVQGRVNVSFEFFPPRTSEMKQALWNPINHLSSLKPKSVSVTYGTNSGECDRTRSIIRGIRDRAGLEAAPHLTYIDATLVELRIIARGYWNNDIRHIVALRNNLSPRSSRPEMYISDLMTLLKEVVDFGVPVVTCPEVHPGTKNVQADLLSPRQKVDARTNRAIAQFLFDVESYLRLCDRCVSAGIDVEIIPGTLSVSNFKQMKKFVDTINVYIPAWMAQIFDGLGDDTETRKLVGANIAMDMVKVLSHEGVKDFYSYMLNRAEVSYTVCHTLGARPDL